MYDSLHILATTMPFCIVSISGWFGSPASLRGTSDAPENVHSNAYFFQGVRMAFKMKLAATLG